MCKKKWIGFVLATVFAASLSACAAEQKDSSAPPSSAGQPQAADSVPALEGETVPTVYEADERKDETEQMLQMKLGDVPVAVDWETNEAVTALQALCRDKPLTIGLSMYGGFEQVGEIGVSLPRNDTQIKATAGDIVLYAGDRLVVFYGTNSWSYTRLGHIRDLSADELEALLGGGDVTVTLTLAP